MTTGPDPFRVLSLPYDADADAVRRAFRRRARETHPDRGGSADAFLDVRRAYGALSDDLDGERQRWRPAPPPAPRYAAGLDPRTYPTCPVQISRPRDGRRTVAYDTAARPPGWRPGAAPPPGGTCVERHAAMEARPAFGVWTVPAGRRLFRCVFGPHPEHARAPERRG